MTIGIVTTWFERGAAYVSRQYKDTLKTDCDVRIFARGGEASGRGDPRWDDGTVHWAKPGARGIITGIQMKDFERWLSNVKPDMVLFNEQHWWPPVLKCRSMGIRTAAYVDYYTEPTVPFFQAYDVLLCNTRRHLDAFQWHKGAHLIAWGTDLQLFRPGTEDLVDEHTVTFFHSAGMNPLRKGTDILVRAARKAVSRFRLIIHTQVPLDTYFPELSPTIRELEASGRLTVLCKTVPSPGLYHLGDIYVYPSRLDGIGLTVAEALACGLPVIATDEPPMSEFVFDNAGFLVDVKRRIARADGYYWPQAICDSDALTRILEKVANDREGVRKMKKAARAAALMNLDWLRNSSGLSDLLARAPRMEIDPVMESKIWSFEADRALTVPAVVTILQAGMGIARTALQAVRRGGRFGERGRG